MQHKKTGVRRAAYGLAAAGAAALLVWSFLPEPLRVETAQADRGAMTVTLDEDGEVRAHDRFVVTAPIAGRLARIALHEGDAVTAGQPVAELWPLQLSARERQEQAARIAAAAAALREAQAHVVHARADLDQARRERARVERLVREKYVSPQAAEQTRIAETTAESAVQAAGFRAQLAAAELQAAEAARLAMAAPGPAVAVVVRSPAAGRVLAIAEKSERVVAAGTPLMAVGDPAQMEIVVDLLSADAVKVSPGMAVQGINWGCPQTLQGRVRTVEPHAYTKVSALGVEEQRVNVVADLLDAPARLGNGYRVEVRIVLWQGEDVLKLPASALFRHGDGWAVFVVEAGRVRLQPVRIGQRNAQEAQILEGLAAGAVVVRHPGNALAEGARVSVVDDRR